jgi:protein-arginine kinase activator protein McsA
MARREEYVNPLVCQKCGKQGTATWEENENPAHHQGALNETLKEVSKGFRKSANSQILCDTCNMRVA